MTILGDVKKLWGGRSDAGGRALPTATRESIRAHLDSEARELGFRDRAARDQAALDAWREAAESR